MGASGSRRFALEGEAVEAAVVGAAPPVDSSSL